MDTGIQDHERHFVSPVTPLSDHIVQGVLRRLNILVSFLDDHAPREASLRSAMRSKPSGAPQEAEPGAQGLVTGMAANTLQPAKQASLQKPFFTTLLGLDHFASMMALILRMKLGQTHELRFFHFAKSSELLQLTETHEFDLVFLYFWNIEWDIASVDGSKSYPSNTTLWGSYSSDESWDEGSRNLERFKARIVALADVLQGIRVKFGKPIIASQGIDVTKELEAKGIIFLTAPFDLGDLLARLEPQLGIPLSSFSRSPNFSIALCGITPGEDFSSVYLTPHLEEILGSEYSVSSHYFSYACQWEVTEDTYDLYVILLNPALLEAGSRQEVDAHQVVAELKRKPGKPVIILTNEGKFGLEAGSGFIEAGADGFFSFLPQWPPEGLRETLAQCVREKVGP